MCSKMIYQICAVYTSSSEYNEPYNAQSDNILKEILCHAIVKQVKNDCNGWNWTLYGFAVTMDTKQSHK